VRRGTAGSNLLSSSWESLALCFIRSTDVGTYSLNRVNTGPIQVLRRHGGKGPAVPIPKELVLLSEGELPNWTGEFR
jgi:hypothetical protein